MFDNAVGTFGMIIDAALQIRDNHGSKEEPKYLPRYRMEELLKAGTKIDLSEDGQGGTAIFRNMEGVDYDEVE